MIPGAPYYFVYFCMDSGQFFKGYTDGRTWNGWACPKFPKESADLMCLPPADPDNPGGPHMRYLSDRDAYICIDDGPDGDIFPGENIVVDGKEIRVYPIGAGCWVWEELMLLCPHCDEHAFPRDLGITIRPYPGSGQIPRGICAECPTCGTSTTMRVI